MRIEKRASASWFLSPGICQSEQPQSAINPIGLGPNEGPENCTERGVPRTSNLMRSDRVGYVVGGAAIITWALRKPSLARAALAGLGGWLLYQAYTGSTPVLKPLGINVNREPREASLAETVVIEEAITIARPRDEVYAFWQRLGN